MALRPDQPCQACLLPVQPSDHWLTIERRVFHRHCFHCFKCRRPMRSLADFRSYDPLAKDKLVCAKCADDQVPNAEGATSRAARECCRCGHTLTGASLGDKRLASGKAICATCYRCVNCRLLICTEDCFELLDELFCRQCELQFRNKRYMLAKMGCGPQMQTLL